MKNSTPATSYVYAIRAIGTNRIKIGTTTNLQGRKAGVQTGCPFPVEIVATWEGGREFEAALHRELAAFRVQGEWFEVCLEKVDAAALFVANLPVPVTTGMKKSSRWFLWVPTGWEISRRRSGKKLTACQFLYIHKCASCGMRASRTVGRYFSSRAVGVLKSKSARVQRALTWMSLAKKQQMFARQIRYCRHCLLDVQIEEIAA